MEVAAWLELPFPETGVIEQETLAEQSRALAAALPERPLVLGGCCCAHIGAIQALVRRRPLLSVIWLDAHGDLNTPETSPSGNEWGMPLRMLLDEGTVSPTQVALVGARSLDPPEVEYLARSGIDDDVSRVLGRADSVYVALDVDVLDPGVIASFVPEPDGLSSEEVTAILQQVTEAAPVVGVGLTGLVPESDLAVVLPLLRSLGL
jgi:arginase